MINEKKIHHHCRCTGVGFTFDEWKEYLKLNPNSNSEAIYSCNGYDYNINDVCINADKERFDLGGGSFVEVRTCVYNDDLWISGYNYFFNVPNNMRGGSAPAICLTSNTHSNQRDAQLSSLQAVLSKIPKSNSCTSSSRIELELKRIICGLEYKQLSLF